jgi:hypothetical protein
MAIIRNAMLILAFLLPGAIAGSPVTAATPRHYDCSKPGNANKTACKNTSTAAPAAAKPTRTTTTEVTTKTTTRHYDCTKAGNANKVACRTAGAETPSGSSPGAVKTTTKTTATTTDCTKWYNRMRAVCRTNTQSSPPRTTVAPAPKPTPAASTTRRSTAAGENSNPTGATAQCKDGTYSHAAHHSGACSHHGGVAKWLS